MKNILVVVLLFLVSPVLAQKVNVKYELTVFQKLELERIELKHERLSVDAQFQHDVAIAAAKLDIKSLTIDLKEAQANKDKGKITTVKSAIKVARDKISLAQSKFKNSQISLANEKEKEVQEFVATLTQGV